MDPKQNPMEENLPCMNCGKATTPGALWGGVYVCHDCANTATIVYHNGLAELAKLKTLLQESIRLLLVQGKLTAQTDATQGKADVLKQIITLQEAAALRKPYEDSK